MSFNPKSLVAGLCAAGAFSACASIPPSQLVQARDAYSTSSTGLASQLAPTELYDAKKALDKANAEFTANGDTPTVRDYAYIAQRRVELADVDAITESDKRTIAEAAKQGVIARDDQVKSGQVALASSQAQLKEERSSNEKTEAELEVEKQGRMSAEAKLAGAMKDLSTIAAVHEEARGVVITLSGSVLFATNKYVLLETAKTKLDQVAEALKSQSDDKRMVIEGHTDSQGSDATNMPLSLNRANAVRDYLVTRGVDANKITTTGMGSSHPLVDNKSAENRANNRRVEIVIQPAAQVSTR